MVTVTDAHSKKQNRDDELVDQLAASGALDELFGKIDSGEVKLTGDGGLVPALIKYTLERGLQAEMTSHLGYAKDDREAKATSNSRNGSCAKTMASEAGDIELMVPRGRAGSFTLKRPGSDGGLVGGRSGFAGPAILIVVDLLELLWWLVLDGAQTGSVVPVDTFSGGDFDLSPRAPRVPLVVDDFCLGQADGGFHQGIVGML